MLAFGIASLIFAVIAIFIPGFGVMVSGVSGMLAWLSAGRWTPLGAAAVIVNFLNIFLFSPGYLFVAGFEASQRTQEESKLFTIWAIVLLIQIAAVVVFIINLAMDYSILPYFKKKIRQSSPKNKPIEFESVKPQSSADPTGQQISKVTQVLVHKIHGGRKKDSKFWSAENDISSGLPGEIAVVPSKTNIGSKKIRRAAKVSLYPLVSVLIVVVTLIFAKPEMFPFLDYHNIYSAVSGWFPDSSRNEKIGTNYTPPRTSTASIPNKKRVYKNLSQLINRKRVNNSEPINISVGNFSQISLSGKVFSWRDENGGHHFSNTNYPADNPTLKVETEINTYSRVTKISVVNNQIYIPVTLQNKGRILTEKMLLDTGCSHTVVPYRHLNYLKSKYGKKVTSTLANGSKTYGRKAYIDLIQVGSQSDQNVTVNGAKIAGSNNTGLLGMDFLKYRPFKIDFKNRFLVWM